MDTSSLTIDGHEVLETLGQGGMGTVYRVRSPQGEERALKVFRPSVGTSVHDRLRFQREFAVASGLSHPGLVRVFDQGFFNGQPYFTMELIRGRNLRDHLRGAPGALQPVIAQLLEAIQHIHRHGVVHRDLKPENVLVEPEGRPRLLDFGLARPRELASGVTEPGTLLGTVHYMAPEQVRGAELDARVDLYAIGVLLYEIVSGRLPFDHEDMMAVLCAILNQEPEPLPGPVGAVVLRLLAKQPADRYQTVDELMHAWAAAFGAQLPVSPSEQPPAILTPRFVGREREMAALARQRSGLVVVRGVGKTRFLEEAAALLQSPARPVLASHPGEGAYGLWLPLLRRAGLPPHLESFRSILAAVLPELGPVGTGSEKNPAHRFRLFEGMLQLLLTQGGPGGLVLVLDDLHATDAASLEFLAYAARNPSLLLLGSSREPLHLEPQLELALGPLDRELTATMANSMLGYAGLTPESATTLFELAEGIPMLIEETLRDAALTRRDGQWHLELRGKALERRLLALEPEVLEVALQAAVLGMSFSFESLHRAVGGSPDELMESLGPLVARRILSEGGLYRFPVRPLWETLEERARSRPDLHARAAHALTEGGDAARLAHHLRLAGQEREAAGHLLRAADSALAVYAFRDALELLEQLPASPEVDERRADCLDGLSQTEQARSQYERLVAQSPPGETRVRLLRKLATCHQRLGTLSQANRTLRRGLAECGVHLPSDGWLRWGASLARPTAFPLEAGRALEQMARLLFFLRPEGWLMDTLAITAWRPRTRGAQTSLLSAYLSGMLLPRLLLPSVRTQLQLTAASVREERDSLKKSTFLSEAGFVLLLCGDARSGLRLNLEALEIGSRLGDLNGLALIEEVCYLNCRYLGDLRQARVHAGRARELAEKTGSYTEKIISVLSLALVLALQRRGAESRALLAEFAGTSIELPFARAAALMVEANLSALEGQHDLCLQLAGECVRYCRHHLVPLWWREARVLELSALLRLNRHAQASRLLPGVRSDALGLAQKAAVLRCQAELRSSREKAHRDLVAALELAVTVENPFEQGHCHLALSRFIEGTQAERSRYHHQRALACWAEIDVLP